MFKGRKLQFNVMLLNSGGINIAKQQLLTADKVVNYYETKGEHYCRFIEMVYLLT
jgi:hypothetical protein